MHGQSRDLSARLSVNLLRVATPFSSPNASQASEHGKIVACANQPPPTMKLRGAQSLKRNSSPGASARNVRSEGNRGLLRSDAAALLCWRGRFIFARRDQPAGENGAGVRLKTSVGSPYRGAGGAENPSDGAALIAS